MINALARSSRRGIGGAVGVLAAAAAAAAAGCGGSSESGPRPPASPGPRGVAAAVLPLRPVSFNYDDPVGDPPEAQLLPVLQRAASTHLPADQYGCVVAPPGDRAQLRVLVRSPRAAPEARSIVRRLGATRYATVRVQPNVGLARDRQVLIADLRRQAVHYGARYPGAATVMENSVVDRTTCPPVVLRDPSRPAVLHRWVRRAASAHPGAVEVRPALTVRPTPIYPDTKGLGERSGG